MTPLGPGGQNGGSGLVATSLVREMARLKPDWDLTLLTSSTSHDELAAFDDNNVWRQCVLNNETPDTPSRTLARRVIGGLPLAVRVPIKKAVWKLRHRGPANGIQADLMLCPFTSCNFWQPGLPLAVIVHDLQHVAYPQFFLKEQRLHRDQHLRDAAEHADAVVCVSDFVRQTLTEYLAIEGTQLVTIHHGLLQRFERPPDAAKQGTYLLYPANFWPHKNHALLFDALAEFRRRRPASSLKLVCTGAPSDAMNALRERQGAEAVEFAGYVSEEGFASLLDNCAALIYPSLYEGFGMPVLEAMARGKPVLCSRLASLQEVAGEAARYFDATSCEDIVRAIVSLVDDPEPTATRVKCGRERAEQFGDAEPMTRAYIDLFERILGA